MCSKRKYEQLHRLISYQPADEQELPGVSLRWMRRQEEKLADNYQQQIPCHRQDQVFQAKANACGAREERELETVSINGNTGIPGPRNSPLVTHLKFRLSI